MNKPYQSYKDSGVPYIGDIPTHWVCKKLKWELTAKSGTDSKSELDNAVFSLFGANGVIGTSDTAEDFSDSGVVLVGRVGSAGAINFVKGKVGVSDNALVIRNLTYSLPRYDYYLLQSANLEDLINKNAQPLITGSDIRERYVAQPKDVTDRQEIADFLDIETKRIDSLIAEKQAFINLLKEKRQALISHFVTKGLDANVPMKDSGVEWIGEIPEHWEAIPLKYLCDLQTGDKDTVMAVPNGQYDFFVRAQEALKIDVYTHECEAVLTAGDGAGVGKVYFYTNGKFSFHQRVYMMNNFKKILGKYFYLYLSSLFASVALDGAAKSTVDSLRMPVFKNFTFTVPPKEEQEAILDKLNTELGLIDELISETAKSVSLLKEHRTALISAAVTGKIDVRGIVDTKEGAA